QAAVGREEQLLDARRAPVLAEQAAEDSGEHAAGLDLLELAGAVLPYLLRLPERLVRRGRPRHRAGPDKWNGPLLLWRASAPTPGSANEHDGGTPAVLQGTQHGSAGVGIGAPAGAVPVA